MNVFLFIIILLYFTCINVNADSSESNISTPVCVISILCRVFDWSICTYCISATKVGNEDPHVGRDSTSHLAGRYPAILATLGDLVLWIKSKSTVPLKMSPYGNKKMPYVEIYFVPYAIYCIKNQ